MLILFKVLLVDDVTAIRDSLCNSVDWALYNMEVAATACNGAEALQIIQSVPIDLVITDIQMGQHGGLELCQKLAESYPQIKIIIMSGFAEFSYAQKAIKYGVLGYCLKPLEYDELCRHLARASQLLKGATSQPNYDDLLDALSCNNPDGITDTLRRLGYALPECYLAMSVGTQHLSLESSSGLWVRIGRRQYAYITYAPIPHNMIVPLIHGENTSFCAKPEKISVADLYTQINQLCIDVFQFFIEPQQRHINAPVHDTAAERLAELSACVSDGEREQVRNCLEGIRTNSEGFTVRSALRLYHLVTISKLFPEGEYEAIFNIEQMVHKYGTFTNMLDNLIHYLSSGNNTSEDSSLPNTKFLHMMNYINENYTQDISLSQIADEFHMNSSYLSHIFKRETGVTFSKYVVNLRIEKAKKMLSAGNNSIGKTAQEVGFNDYFYFLKTFKRVTGMTPRQYCIGDISD